jgi:hypothetical protein
MEVSLELCAESVVATKQAAKANKTNERRALDGMDLGSNLFGVTSNCTEEGLNKIDLLEPS